MRRDRAWPSAVLVHHHRANSAGFVDALVGGSSQPMPPGAAARRSSVALGASRAPSLLSEGLPDVIVEASSELYYRAGLCEAC
jgi:hypothetical protein